MSAALGKSPVFDGCDQQKELLWLRRKTFTRAQIALIYAALLALILVSGCCVYITHSLIG